MHLNRRMLNMLTHPYTEDVPVPDVRKLSIKGFLISWCGLCSVLRSRDTVVRIRPLKRLCLYRFRLVHLMVLFLDIYLYHWNESEML